MLKDYADNPWIVVTAYIAVFFPWTAVTATDFLSATWKPVAQARHDGQLQLLFVIVPTIYIVFYICVQFIAEDYKEAFAAVVGLIFALLHLLRTAWGLWQLSAFRRWAARAISALQFAGIKYKLSDGDEDASPDALADCILINNSIVDNQLLHGDVRCYLCYGEFHLRAASSSGPTRFLNSLFARVKVLFLIPLLSLHWFFWLLLVGFARLYSMRLKPQTQPRQVPLEPVELWLNWATAFVSQGLGAWVDDIDDVMEHPDISLGAYEGDVMELYRARRVYFAEEVLASAVLQMGRGGMGKGFVRNPMLWGTWTDCPSMSDGRLTKQELFCKAVKAGDGLPFETPQDELYVNRKGTRREYGVLGEETVGYGPYATKLQRVVESMPAAFGEQIGRFDVAKLEWFTILLYIGILGNRSEPAPASSSEAGGFDNDPDSLDERMGDDGAEYLGDQDLAVDNLGLQLGFGRDASGRILNLADKTLRVFPFNREPLTLVSETNRLVLKVAELIDVWLSLVSGEQMSFLLGIEDSWEELCLAKNDERAKCLHSATGGTAMNHGFGVPAGGKEERMCNHQLRESQEAVASAALEYQFAQGNQRYAHMEQTLTFMGYDMEYVRTQLAQWVAQNESEQSSAWSPIIPYRSCENFMKCEPVVAGNLSNELSEEICCAKRPCYLQQRAVHVRLLWEIRALLQGMVGKTEEGPSSTEAMIACVMAFTSLNVDFKEIKGEECVSRPRDRGRSVQVDETVSGVSILFGTDTPHDRKSTREWLITIRPQCPPQRLFVEVQLFSNYGGPLSVEASLGRSSEDRDDEFRWECWRDSFISRLKAVERWQQLHNMNSPEASDSTTFISEGLRVTPVYLRGTGEELMTWAGWMPFRFGICRAELLSPGFVTQLGPKRKIRIKYRSKLLVEYIAKGGSGHWTTTIDLQDRVAVSYLQAKRESLHHACLVVREVLGGVSGGFDDAALKTKGREEQVRSVLKQAEEVLIQRPHQADRALVLLDVAAVELGSTLGLRRLVELLSSGRYIKKDPARAVDAIERCVAVYLGRMTWSRRHSVSERLGKRADDIHSIYCGLIDQYGCDEKVVVSYARWMSMTIRDSLRDTEYVHARIREALLYTRTPVLLTCLATYTIVPDVSNVPSSANDLQETASSPETETTLNEHFTWAKESFIIRSRNRLRYSLLELSIKEISIDVANNSVIVPRLGSEGKHDYREDIDQRDLSRRRGQYAAALFNLGSMLRYGVEGMKRDSERAAALYERAAENGSVDAMNNFANMLLNGEGTGKYPARAVGLYEQAIASGDMDAAYNLGLLLMDGGEGIARDQQRALGLYEKAIEEGGSVSAMINLAIKLFHGDDCIEKDPRRAVNLYERAISANGDDADAMFNLANSLITGAAEVPIDAKRAADLYGRAIEVGNHVESMYNLANLLVRGADGVAQDHQRAAGLYERAIDIGGHQNSLSNLAVLLRQGAEGVPRDLNRAARLYQRAIDESGQPNAMFNLAILMEKGPDGFQRNLPMAVKLYERLIDERKHVDAMINLANCLWFPADGVEGNPRRSVALLEKAIGEGQDPVAMVNLANCLWSGKAEVAQDRARAMRLYERAIDEGNHVDAMVAFAQSIRHGVEGYPKNVHRAVQLYERAIEEGGNVIAMYNLAVLLENGSDRVVRNVQKALELYDRAVSEAQDVDSMIRLAELISTDRSGVEKNASRAVELYERAIESENNVTAMINLGVILCNEGTGVDRNPKRAAELYSTAIELGDDPTALVNLSILLIEGCEGIEKDTRRGAELLERAVEKGNIRAMHALATRLYIGSTDGIPQDIRRAASLYEKAAFEGKHVGAMVTLGFMLWKGVDGVEKDMKRGVQLFEMAAKEGDVTACTMLGLAFYNGGESVQKDTARAAKLFEVAIDKGNNAIAMQALASLLEGGAIGVEKNVQRAVELHRRAVDEGNVVDSMKALLRLFAICDEVEPDQGEVARLRARLQDLGEPS